MWLQERVTAWREGERERDGEREREGGKKREREREEEKKKKKKKVREGPVLHTFVKVCASQRVPAK